MSAALSRRGFLRAGAAAGGGLFVQVFMSSCAERREPEATTRSDAATPNIWLRITRDQIIFTVAAAEMGQGVMTGLATLMCEELDLDPRKLELVLAPGDPRFHSPGLPIQVTGGSETIRRYSEPLRRAGATAREQLKRAAAFRWRASVSDVTANDGRIIHRDGRSASYNELADTAAMFPLFFAPPLKPASRFKWMGKPQARLDAVPKVFGAAVFGMDVKIPGLRTAVVVRSPVIGGKVRSFDASAAIRTAGVEDVVNLGHGVAVVGRTYWDARNGARALSVTWDEGPMAGVSSDDIRDQFRAAVARGGGLVARRSSGQLRAKLDAAPTRRSGVYGMPYLAHAPMEPMNCTARVTSSECEVWVGSQVPGIARKIAAQITNLPPSRVTVHSTLLGGGFGRRGRSDFVSEAVTVAKLTGKPVKVVWSREDDTRCGSFRPCAYHEIEGAVDASGQLVGIVHKVACQSVYAGTAPEIVDAMFPGMQAVVARAGGVFGKFVDPTSVEGSADTEYEIPDFSVEYFPQNVGVPVGSWRSVGHSFNAFVMETFIDELASAASRDPVEFRRHLLLRKARLRTVLEEVAELANWGTPPPPGLFRGVACHKSFESYAAAVAEVAIDGGRIVPKRVVIGIDCGEVVNPDIVKMQLESAVIFGLSAALKGRITLQDGRVVQSSFHNYEVLRMFEAPRIETHIVASHAPSTGVGEPGVPVLAPAVANAVFAATGRRLRELPLSLRP